MPDRSRPFAVLAYGDSNTWGAVPQPYRGAGGRFCAERWTRVTADRLGSDFEVIEAGLNGRTTCVDDPVEGIERNGVRHLQVAVQTHMPVDLVIIMLGTNDLKARLSMTAGDIADGAGRLCDMVRRSNWGPEGRAPRVLLVSPAPLGRLTWLAEMFAGGTEKSRRLAEEYRRVAKAMSAEFFEGGSVMASSDDDGIHLGAEAHLALGEALAAEVRRIAGAARQG
ncbi:hydrolase [Arsenicitalea aurantiaca]|uniref:Hydrolase n=1 Tax=Arsenicitalea aurantiaca TaxID=1783274 RepID=A0A433XLD3_9HYPH|nr:SGNH/GDSL hydrolase family protein [Arsenicitalea aurantiaca]RUT34871.1 hydrolase [Arsenicitalea aurantiaca]